MSLISSMLFIARMLFYTFIFIVIVGAIYSVWYRIKPFYKTSDQFVDAPAPKKASIVLVHATWCGHCTRFIKSGAFDKLASKNPSVEFNKVDVDQNKEFAKTYNVTSFPTILAIVNTSSGEKVLRFDKDRSDQTQLQSFVNQAKALAAE